MYHLILITKWKRLLSLPGKLWNLSLRDVISSTSRCWSLLHLRSFHNTCDCCPYGWHVDKENRISEIPNSRSNVKSYLYYSTLVISCLLPTSKIDNKMRMGSREANFKCLQPTSFIQRISGVLLQVSKQSPEIVCKIFPH